MALLDELRKLLDLQQVDSQIYQREQALSTLDSGETLKREAIEIMKRHDAAQAVLQKAEAAQKNRELELKSIESKRAAVHEKLYSGRVTNPKELGDLQKDEEMLDEQIGRVEETLLGEMDATETARDAFEKLVAALDDAKHRWKDTVNHTQQETARLRAEIAGLRPERERLAALVERPLLRRYEDTRARRAGLGIVPVFADTCPACHVKLNSRIMNALREGEDVVICENCDRILLLQA